MDETQNEIYFYEMRVRDRGEYWEFPGCRIDFKPELNLSAQEQVRSYFKYDLEARGDDTRAAVVRRSEDKFEFFLDAGRMDRERHFYVVGIGREYLAKVPLSGLFETVKGSLGHLDIYAEFDDCFWSDSYFEKITDTVSRYCIGEDGCMAVLTDVHEIESMKNYGYDSAASGEDLEYKYVLALEGWINDPMDGVKRLSLYLDQDKVLKPGELSLAFYGRRKYGTLGSDPKNIEIVHDLKLR